MRTGSPTGGSRIFPCCEDAPQARIASSVSCMVRNHRLACGWVTVTGSRRAICSRKSGNHAAARADHVAQERIAFIRQAASLRDTTTSSAILLDTPIMLDGWTALSVEISTSFGTPPRLAACAKSISSQGVVAHSGEGMALQHGNLFPRGGSVVDLGSTGWRRNSSSRKFASPILPRATSDDTLLLSSCKLHSGVSDKLISQKYPAAGGAPHRLPR